MAKSQKEVEAEVRSWGFSHVFTWTDSPNSCKFIISLPATHTTAIRTEQQQQQQQQHQHQEAHIFSLTRSGRGETDYPPHSHQGLTTHVILRGQLTIAYPEDGDGREKARTTHGVGERVDVDAGRVHEVWIGPEGCTYVIGE